MNHITAKPPRRGTATVEAAVCLPVVLLLLFGSIEAANAVFLKQTATMAAYEGAATGSRAGVTSAAVRDRCRTVLQARNVSQFRVDVNPPSLSERTPTGTPVYIRITIPASEAAMGPLWLYEGREVSHTAHMPRTK
ncbi:MAG: pilus assembly protein [Planctomycetaceae bacterium]|nr:pilus assembly protein [Planctomycetaceae bacterium]